MDLTAILVGSVIGLATGLVPGLHVNTIAALAAFLAPEPSIAVALIAVGTVHTFVSILPATYLGAPGEDTALTALPAHRMLMAGRAPEAVRISVQASLAAVVAVVALGLPYKWILTEPLRVAPLLDAWMPWVLAGVLLALVLQEAAHDRTRALVVMGLAGWLGWRVSAWPTKGLVDVPASVLLPLLTGLFAAPTLLAAMHDASTPPAQVAAPNRSPRTMPADVMVGTVAAAFTAVLPGLTAAVATAVARSRHRVDDPRPIIATLSAVNTAHLAFSLLVVWIIGATRSGLADAIRPTLATGTWEAGAPPAGLHAALFALLAGGLIAAAGTRLLEPIYRRAVTAIQSRVLHGGVLAFLVAVAIILSGPWGLVVFVVATAVGLTPLAFGVRRVHLAASLIVPVLVRAAL